MKEGINFSAAKKFIFKMTLHDISAVTACNFLYLRSGLSRVKIKDAMNKGAFWIKNKRGKLRRLRRATTRLNAGDHIEFYYDKRLLSIKPPYARCISDLKHYSVWFKPAGLMSQGTMYGDHCSLMRQAELFFRNSREIFLVHRLDREASGPMLLAHTKDAAARLSKLFQDNRIIKRYQAEVLGKPEVKGENLVIDFPLDGKSAVTGYEVVSYNPETNTSLVNVIIKTGRLHQIRRHFDMIGFPVMGDPKYGKGNKNTEGMKLSAVSLRFKCPFQKREVEFTTL